MPLDRFRKMQAGRTTQRLSTATPTRASFASMSPTSCTAAATCSSTAPITAIAATATVWLRLGRHRGSLGQVLETRRSSRKLRIYPRALSRGAARMQVPSRSEPRLQAWTTACAVPAASTSTAFSPTNATAASTQSSSPPTTALATTNATTSFSATSAASNSRSACCRTARCGAARW